MKKIIFMIAAFGTLSAFATNNEECELTAYEEIMSSKTVDAKLQLLLTNPDANLEQITLMSQKAMALAIESCR